MAYFVPVTREESRRYLDGRVSRLVLEREDWPALVIMACGVFAAPIPVVCALFAVTFFGVFRLAGDVLVVSRLAEEVQAPVGSRIAAERALFAHPVAEPILTYQPRVGEHWIEVPAEGPAEAHGILPFASRNLEIVRTTEGRWRVGIDVGRRVWRDPRPGE